DLGEESKKIGKMAKIDEGHKEISKARDAKMYVNIQHVKSVHCP
ncbi:DUF2642 domain-containing protein, partial [Bacillus cereus]|nr:DUF2642 domain-containing protein [Bacillus cereus]